MASPMDVFITVDTEVWPVHPGGWPNTPLLSDQLCSREISAYLQGDTQEGQFGLPYQLAMLNRFGLSATYFVDPLFSFALGLEPLRQVVQAVESAGQKVALHLHPEWLTDPRCKDLPEFKGPYLSSYSPQVQQELVRVGKQRLIEAGATPLRAFRAGSWGANLQTLRVLRAEGITVDSSLNARYPHSVPDLAQRDALQDTIEVGGIVEYPVTRFHDGTTPGGRPLTVIGSTWSEIRFVLEACRASGRKSVVLVMHSNEFTRTERLWTSKPVTPRKVVAGRFAKLCEYLARNSPGIQTRHMTPDGVPTSSTAAGTLPTSTALRTGFRMISQFASRWY